MYENFMLIKNLYFFGICDGHGSKGHYASDHAKLHIASNLVYFEIANYLQKKGKTYEDFDVNIERFSCEENILKILYNKLNILVNNFTFAKRINKYIHTLIKDSFKKAHQDLKNRSFDTEYSGTTVCSVFVIGRMLYCANLGDSRAVMGSFESVY